ncbi:hypothetical protein EV193_10977 [Herbihabitans rhizosphaerae]|uniref:Type III secretion system (T3SS) SseB-like protein n=1 Tax=Herbihabitans rhizosphaerae TaxID=1872711 RepID=A0A4Q7KHB2_9PSEU|nr:SAV_915 family protein [Herbihabitans rhizosphaerae]RZS34290.1 hypothetical protein EV193_10977 [Herbihabitans rhizosphaerae]
MDTEFPPPPVVYVACHETGVEKFSPVLIDLDDGRVALCVYTALDRLHALCGREQPWTALATARLDDLHELMPFDVVMPDADLLTGNTQLPDGNEQRVVPPVVYLACADTSDDQFVPDLHWGADGTRMLLVYSALDRLIDLCGPHQRWAVVPVERLDEIREQAPFDRVEIDAEIPEQHRRKAA